MLKQVQHDETENAVPFASEVLSPFVSSEVETPLRHVPRLRSGRTDFDALS